MDLAEEIRKIAENNLTPAQFVVDVLISAKKGPKKVMVIVDGDNGFSIDDCALLSRQLSKVLDERNLIEDNYMLEVSTPGIDQPLKLNRQYVKNIGRSIKLKLRDKVVEGKLTAVTSNNITLVEEVGSGKNKTTKSVELPIAEIEKAFVQVSFK